MSYYFFLSYARLDRDSDSYLKKFYKDLAITVRRLKGLQDENIGFFDEEKIEPGQNWPASLAHALQNTRVFVSVFSRTYFTREHCGKEWRVFSSRLDKYSRGLATRPPLILPVLWVPEEWLPKPLPSAVSDVQYKHSDFGELYAKEGLHQLMALRMHRDRYKIFLQAFADKLIRAGDLYPVPPLDNLQPLKQIRSAWEQETTLVPGFQAAKPISSAVDSGPRWAQFVFVAGCRGELQQYRQILDFYGPEEGVDWKPYLPESADEAYILAQDIAADEKLRYQAIPLDDFLLDRLTEAQENNKLVVILTDSWSLQVDRYRKLMEQFDAHNFLNCTVLIPWNLQDEETVTNLEKLGDLIKYAFSKNVISKNPNYFFDSIKSLADFKKQLSASLNETRTRIIQYADVRKKAEGGKVILKPIITGSEW